MCVMFRRISTLLVLLMRKKFSDKERVLLTLLNSCPHSYKFYRLFPWENRFDSPFSFFSNDKKKKNQTNQERDDYHTISTNIYTIYTITRNETKKKTMRRGFTRKRRDLIKGEHPLHEQPTRDQHDDQVGHI